MTMMKKLALMMLALSIVLSAGIIATSATTEAHSNAEMNDFYSVIHTEAWKSMTRGERIQACQIPEETLADMPTDELLEAVLQYPFLIDMMLCDSYRTGFVHVYNECSALRELGNRKDFSDAVIETYQAAARSVSSERDTENLFLQIILAQPEMTNQCTEEELNTLIQYADNIFDEDEYSAFPRALKENPDSRIASYADIY